MSHILPVIYRGLHSTAASYFRHDLRELDPSMLVCLGTDSTRIDQDSYRTALNGKIDRVYQLFNSVTINPSNITMKDRLDQLLVSSFDRYSTVLDTGRDPNILRFETNSQQSRIRKLKAYLIKYEINGKYHQIEGERRRCRERAERTSDPVDYDMVRFVRLLRDGRLLRRNAEVYYNHLVSLYNSLNYEPVVAYLGGRSLELLLQRVMFANSNLLKYNQSTIVRSMTSFAIRLLGDCSKSGTKLTRRELFKLLQLATNQSGSTKLQQIYRQFVSDPNMQVDCEFFNCFLNICMPLELSVSQPNNEFARQILQDLFQQAPALVPDRMTDLELLTVGAGTGDKMLVIESFEHLLRNYHLDINSVRIAIRSLLNVGEYELARYVFSKYFSQIKEVKEPVPYMGLGRDYKISVRLIDLLLGKNIGEEAATGTLGFQYRLSLDKGVVDCFERYFSNSAQTPYIVKQEGEFSTQIEAISGEKLRIGSGKNTNYHETDKGLEEDSVESAVGADAHA